MIDALGVLMGIDIQAQTRPEGSSDDFPQQSARPSTPPPAARPKETKPTPAQEDVEMEDVDEEEAEAKKQAEASKNLGSEAYKKREFDTAISHFEKAWDIYPKDVTFLSNAAGEVIALMTKITSKSDYHLAAYLEKGDYDKAIEICEKAVDEGRSVSHQNRRV